MSAHSTRQSEGMRVLAYQFERESGIAAELMRLGVRVDERLLTVADYVVEDVAIIERKTVADLHQSVYKGRFWTQIGRMRRAKGWPYLLVEGKSLYRRGLSDEAMRGLILAVTDLGVTVCRSEDTKDSARWIRRIGLRRLELQSRDRPRYAQRPQRRARVSPAEAALAAAPNVSVSVARALLSEFGTLRNVLLASRDELVSVHGVGPSRADALTALAQGTSHSDVRRNGEHLST